MSQGFFNKSNLQMKSRPGGRTLSCASCGLYKECKSPKMGVHGNGKRNILNIGTAPDDIDDRRGKQWQGKTGGTLADMYARHGIDLYEDCWNINAVNCRPPDNRPPTNHEIDCCRSVIVEKLIDELQPKAIVLHGNAALYSFLGHRWKKDLYTITRWRGFAIPDKEFKSWVFPVYHPSFVEQSEREANTIWSQDIKRVAEMVDDPLPRWPKPKIHMVDDIEVLDTIETGVASLDYETTGLKPHGAGHRIVSASISPDPDTAYAFLMPKTRRGRAPLANLLTNRSISKLGHHIKFEDSWTRHRLYVEVQNWAFDSMLAAHVIDNRPNITGLKFLTYVMLGELGYETEVAPYMKSVDAKNGNSMNRMLELAEKPGGREMILKYNGLDTIYEHRIAKIQMDLIDFDYLPF